MPAAGFCIDNPRDLTIRFPPPAQFPPYQTRPLRALIGATNQSPRSSTMKSFIPSVIGASVIGLITLAGCSTDRVAQVGSEPRAAISEAALASYPQQPAVASDR